MNKWWPMPPAGCKVRNKLFDLATRFAPRFLGLLRCVKRARKRKRLFALAKECPPVTRQTIGNDLALAGISRGDLLMVHSSLSSMGFVEGGAATVVSALLDAVGLEGTLAMPAFAHNTFSKYYLDRNPVFDVLNSPSLAGSITEAFRKLPGTLRSFHPTDAVCAKGPLASWLLKDHFGQMTPYNSSSPYARIAERKGKILCIGVPLLTSCTNLHTLEDAVDFKFPVYHRRVYEVTMVDDRGVRQVMKTRVHDPAWSQKRKPDELIPLFVKEGILHRVAVGMARAYLIDAAGLFEVMVRHYRRNGITMYTPTGDEKPTGA